MNKLASWLRKKILRFLKLDWDCYLGVDVGTKRPTECILVKRTPDGVEVIGEWNSPPDQGYADLLRDVTAVARKYRIQDTMIMDKPLGFD